jgi:hypothetical protein
MTLKNISIIKLTLKVLNNERIHPDRVDHTTQSLKAECCNYFIIIIIVNKYDDDTKMIGTEIDSITMTCMY